MNTSIMNLTKKDIEQAVTLINEVAVNIAAGGFQPLTASQKKHLPKAGRGHIGIVAAFTAIAARYGIDNPAAPVAGVNATLATLQEIEPLVSAVSGLHFLLQDMHLAGAAHAWGDGTALYQMLQSSARTNPVLRRELDPIKAQLRTNTGKRGKAKEGAPTTTVKRLVDSAK